MVVGARSVPIAPGVTCFRDTCNVYVLKSGREAVLIDFGSGEVLDQLQELGIDRVTDVLVTHHHRDQVQGLERALAAGARVWVPPVEKEFFTGATDLWRRRQIGNDYELRQVRFAPLADLPVAGTVSEYRRREYGAFEILALPTPGHTLGSVTYLVDLDGRRLAFSGDLVQGDGKVWSLAATQWTYSGVEGWAATIISCSVLTAAGPTLLLPSHGEPIEEPAPALASVAERMQQLMDLRLEKPWSIAERLERPFSVLSRHFLRNRTMFSNSYVLLSETGAALIIDFGYDLTTTATATERSARRTLLWSLDGLRRDFGVTRIDAVIPTHYHDDHVAGINLLRDVEGTEVWAPANVASILEDPARHDLPCLWFDPIPVDRVLAPGEPVRWHEYELRVHPLPGHTRFAAAVELEVDGRRVLATGDQQADTATRPILNYQYRNRFEPADFIRSAELYRRLRPDLIVSGHWLPQEVDDAYLDALYTDARRLADLHRDLLPDEGLGTDGFAARIEPYTSTVAAGSEVELDVIVRNPFDRDQPALVRLAVPDGWAVAPDVQEVALEAGGEAIVTFRLRASASGVVAADITIGDTRFGEQAEALVEVR